LGGWQRGVDGEANELVATGGQTEHRAGVGDRLQRGRAS
jgi:hypothetical protein